MIYFGRLSYNAISLWRLNNQSIQTRPLKVKPFQNSWISLHVWRYWSVFVLCLHEEDFTYHFSLLSVNWNDGAFIWLITEHWTFQGLRSCLRCQNRNTNPYLFIQTKSVLFISPAQRNIAHEIWLSDRTSMVLTTQRGGVPSIKPQLYWFNRNKNYNWIRKRLMFDIICQTWRNLNVALTRKVD